MLIVCKLHSHLLIHTLFVTVSLHSMQDKIAKTRYWPVEVFRTPQAAGGKGGKGKEDDNHISYHGIIYLNLAPLLYPGVKRIRGAYKVYPYMENELHEKVGH